MYWLHTTFKDYCDRKGIHLLKDDLKFIIKVLNNLPPNSHKSIMRDYCDKWLHTLEKEKNSSQRQNLARRASNSWLVNKVL